MKDGRSEWPSEGNTTANALDMMQHDQKLQDYWVKRFFASLVDVILILTPVYVFSGLLSLFGGHLWYTGGIISGFVWFLYSAFFEMGAGGTIGKMLLGMRVVSLQGRLELVQAIMRNVTKVFALLLVIDMLLTFLMETADPRQRYMDRMAKTALVLTS